MKTARNAKARRTAAQMHALAALRREIVSSDSANGRKYLREFTRAFQRYDTVLSTEKLNEKITAADILLIGDYHALPASQRFAARLVETGVQHRPVVLGLEAVLSRDQRILDAWWRREIPEDELRQRLRFDREWGYQWTPFYELLITAREHTDGIYGLDCMPREDLRRIGSRDRHAAAKICEMREQHPNAAILVLFGESHMAPQHLPNVLQGVLPAQSILTVLQNVDALYWQAVGKEAAAVSIGDNAVCVFNSSPLEKYESYRLCFERWNAAADDLPDFAPAVYNLILSLARCLGFRLDSPRNGTQPKFLADSLPEVVCVQDGATATGQATVPVGDRGCLYVPETNTFFIREFQMAGAAEEATRFLHFACRGMVKASVHAKAVEDALAHFGLRLLCPGFETGESSQSEGFGESLYQAYIKGRTTKSALRRMFLAHIEHREQAEEIFAEINRAGSESGV
jgi:hypothetical protein